MRHEFNTQYGKIALERNTLFITNPYRPFTQTALARFSLNAVYILGFGIFLLWPEDDRAKYWTRLMMWGLMLALRLPDIYTDFLKTSWTNRLPLRRVLSFEAIPDSHNLLTTIRLKLDNGRTRSLLFRTNESSLQEFTSLLSAQTAAVTA